MNIDGPAKRLAGAGGILGDDLGTWLGAFVHNIGISTSIRAELWAVKSGHDLI